MISRQEYAQWVDWAKHNYINIPEIMVSNYEAWECRSMLGRYLYVAKQYEPAISILETVTDIKVSAGDGGDHYPTELEMKVWSLQCLSLALVFERNDLELALYYMKKALRLADRTKVYFHFVVRGQLWLNCLLFKVKLGGKSQAKREARNRLARLVLVEGQSNSYYFYGYAFLAKMAMEAGKAQEAFALFKQGLRAYNLEEPDERLVKEAEEYPDRAHAFTMLWSLVDTPYRLWDEPKNWERGDCDAAEEN